MWSLPFLRPRRLISILQCFLSLLIGGGILALYSLGLRYTYTTAQRMWRVDATAADTALTINAVIFAVVLLTFAGTVLLMPCYRYWHRAFQRQRPWARRRYRNFNF